MVRVKNAPHVSYARKIGVAVGLRHAQNNEGRYTAKQMVEHYNNAFIPPIVKDVGMKQALEMGFSRKDLAKDLNDYRKALNAFKSGYNHGYKRGKEGYKGFPDHLENPGKGDFITVPMKIVGNQIQAIASTPFQKKAFSKFVSKLKRITKGK